jgi:hypothetical protein
MTAKEIEACEALTFLATGITDSTLDGIPIYPVIAKNKWQAALPRHLAKFPLGLGREGFWHVS